MKLRTLNYEGLTSLDRVYLFTLHYCKIKFLMFRDRCVLMYRIGAATAGKKSKFIEENESVLSIINYRRN